MSIATRQPVQIHITWGALKGLPKIRTALHNAIVRALKRAVKRTITLMDEIVPESEERVPPYPESYKSEALLATAKDILNNSFTTMKKGGFKRRYFLKYGYPASYARFINLKRNVKNWSKEGSETGFFGQAKQLLIKAMREELKVELVKNPQLSQFIGARIFG